MSSALVLYWWSHVAQVCDTGSTTAVVLSVTAARNQDDVLCFIDVDSYSL